MSAGNRKKCTPRPARCPALVALVRATFQGFKALPAPVGESWWQVLGVKQTDTLTTIKAAYRRLAAEHHPDRGGDQTRMAAINRAFEAAQKECNE